MKRTVYRDGNARVVLTADMDAWARGILDQTTRACVEEAERELEPVRADAEREYYGPNGVRKETGRGGEIAVVTTIDAARNVIRVGVGSVDTRPAGKSGKVVALFQHRPGPLSMIKRPATHEDFKTGKAKASPRGEKIVGRGVVEERNPKASDGKHLIPEFVTKPARKVIRTKLKPAIVARLKAAIENGGAK